MIGVNGSMPITKAVGIVTNTDGTSKMKKIGQLMGVNRLFYHSHEFIWLLLMPSVKEINKRNIGD